MADERSEAGYTVSHNAQVPDLLTEQRAQLDQIQAALIREMGVLRAYIAEQIAGGVWQVPRSLIIPGETHDITTRDDHHLPLPYDIRRLD